MIGQFPFSKDDGNGNITRRLNAWIEKQNLTDKEAFKALEAILNQRKNISLVRNNAKKAGLKLERFISNSALEIYFDILIKGRGVGYISKGWKDPGFRVGEYFEMDKRSLSFKDKFYKIFQLCSVNLISVSVSEKNSGKIGISLEIGIYQDGFSSKVLKSAVDAIESTMSKIKSVIHT